MARRSSPGPRARQPLEAVATSATLGHRAIEQPGTPPLHLLLELDRGTEDRRRLLTKAHGWCIFRGPPVANSSGVLVGGSYSIARGDGSAR